MKSSIFPNGCKTFHISVDYEVAKKFEEICYRERKSVSERIREHINQEIKSYRPKHDYDSVEDLK